MRVDPAQLSLEQEDVRVDPAQLSLELEQDEEENVRDDSDDFCMSEHQLTCNSLTCKIRHDLKSTEPTRN